jgi:hypothetical protein
VTLLSAGVLLAAACGGGSTHPFRLPAGDPPRSPGPDFAAIPTPATTPNVVGLFSEDQFVTAGLKRLGQFNDGPAPQLAVPQFLYGNSALDMLKLAASGTAPAATVPAMLTKLGFQSLYIREAVAQRGNAVRQWTVRVYRFRDAAAAAEYAASPFLLPPALGRTSPQAAPTGLGGPGAHLWQAQADVVTFYNAGSPRPGSLAVAVWTRGQIVFEVKETDGPAIADLGALTALASDIDRGATTIPGSGIEGQ